MGYISYISTIENSRAERFNELASKNSKACKTKKILTPDPPKNHFILANLSLWYFCRGQLFLIELIICVAQRSSLYVHDVSNSHLQRIGDAESDDRVNGIVASLFIMVILSK
jgi:hypothetical protein